jgi:phosphatidate cytidylyltransferase
MIKVFKARVLTAVIGIPVLLGILYLGGIYWKILFALMGIVAFLEFARMMSNVQLKPLLVTGLLLLVLLLFAPDLYLHLGIFGILILAVTISILNYPDLTIKDIAISLFGAAYLGFLLSYAIKIADLQHSFLIIVLALVLTWGSDTGAYFAGKLWGRHKMTPNLSPNKTWEGAVGGLVVSTITALIFFLVIDIDGVGLAYALLLGIGASILAQLGDLFISGAKRFFQVKDSGKIIPGHGGVLDRFDSFLLLVPLVYYFSIYII